jgi:hypothetical protein
MLVNPPPPPPPNTFRKPVHDCVFPIFQTGSHYMTRFKRCVLLKRTRNILSLNNIFSYLRDG